jgi:hypothetical protein
MPGKSIAYASVISVLAIVVVLGTWGYHRLPVDALKAVAAMGAPASREVPALGAREMPIDAAFFEQAHASFIEHAHAGVGEMHRKRSFNRYFSAVERTMDESVLTLARNFDDRTTLRLAIRPYTSAWIGEYVWLIRHLRKLGYQFDYLDSREALQAGGQRKTIFLRYDIHARDLAPLYGIVDANEALKLPAVAFLQWRYSDVERLYDSDFKRLDVFGWSFLHIGLHTDNVERHFLAQHSYRSYVRGALNDSVSENPAKTHADDPMQRGWSEHVEQIAQLHQNAWTEFQSHFPNATTIAFHGSPTRRRFIRECADDPRFCKAWEELMAKVTEQCRNRSSDCNIVDFYRYIYPLTYASDTSKEPALLCALQRASDRGQSVQLLLHPAQFSRGVRSYLALGLEPGSRVDCPQDDLKVSPDYE